MLPQLEKATPELALDYATRLFVAGERVDMGALAQALGVSRATLYRWTGSREQVISAVLVRLAAGMWTRAEADAGGEGLERALAATHAFMDAVTTVEPLRTFVQAEPQVALNVLLDVDGVLMTWLHERARQMCSAFMGGDAPTPSQIDVAIKVALALQWPAIIIGKDPEVDGAIGVMRVLLTA